MVSPNFYPRFDALEDRHVPSVSPAEAFAALTRVSATTAEVRELADTLGAPRTTREFQFIAGHFRALADQSRADGAVLGEYLFELQSQIAANPALTTTFGPFAGGIGHAVFEASIDAAYAEVFALGFGASPRLPPPPPPFVETPPNFGPPAPTTGTTPATTGGAVTPTDTATPPTTPTTDNATTGGTTPGGGTGTATPPASTLPFSLADPNFETRASGVKVWDVTPGSGTAVRVGDQVTLNYTGYLTDGTKFDSSFDRNQPLQATLSTANLIPGFVEGVTGLQPGGVRRVFIPAALGYGSQARTGIPANSDLVFEITLVSSP